MTTDVAQWWYELNGERKGPVKSDEINELIGYGVLKHENLVWTVGFETWKPVKATDFSVLLKKDIPPPITGANVNNTLVWWLAFAPLLGQLLEGFFLELFFPAPKLDYDSVNSMVDYSHYLTHTDFNAFWFVTLALNLYLCHQDEKKLIKAGYDKNKLGSYFLIPVYLYKRAELLKQNNAYFWVWLLLFIITLVA